MIIEQWEEVFYCGFCKENRPCYKRHFSPGCFVRICAICGAMIDDLGLNEETRVGWSKTESKFRWMDDY